MSESNSYRELNTMVCVWPVKRTLPAAKHAREDPHHEQPRQVSRDNFKFISYCRPGREADIFFFWKGRVQSRLE
jgi:hypothetical protein